MPQFNATLQHVTCAAAKVAHRKRFGASCSRDRGIAVTDSRGCRWSLRATEQGGSLRGPIMLHDSSPDAFAAPQSSDNLEYGVCTL